MSCTTSSYYLYPWVLNVPWTLKSDTQVNNAEVGMKSASI